MNIEGTASRTILYLGTLVAVAIGLGSLVGFVLWPRAWTVYVEVDLDRFRVTTSARQVGDVLVQLGIALREEDRVIPPLEAPVRPGMTIRVQYARPVVLVTGDRQVLYFTQAQTVGAFLAEQNLVLTPQDEVWIGDQRVTLDTPLPPPAWVVPDPTRPWVRSPRPITLRVRRSVPLYVTDDGMTYMVWTTAPTVGEALHRAGVPLYLGDVVLPGLGEPVSAYLQVTILRSTPIVIQVDDQVIQTRTRAQIVADALAEQGVYLTGWDKVRPSLRARLRDGLRIRVSRVQEYIQVEDERVPFETVYMPDDTLEIDNRRVITEGRPGIYRRRYRVRVEDGVEVSRVLEDAWMAQEPITRVIAYGRKIVTRTLETPDGPIVYWRRIRMLATSYSAATAGVDPSRPWYGITRLGLPMRRGIVAVDPRVIPLGTYVYVPGYGKGYAADTGSRILGRRIDLGYNDWDLVLWNQWVDVYLLAPPPPPDKINYLIPNWPRPP